MEVEPQPETKEEEGLSDAEIQLVQDSWSKVEPIAETAANIFYATLFEMDAELRPLFPEDMSEQKKKLMATIAFAVGALRKPDELAPAVKALGERHGGYGVKPAHYDTVGAALLSTLREGLGEAFSEPVEVAWTKTYGWLANTMIEASS